MSTIYRWCIFLSCSALIVLWVHYYGQKKYKAGAQHVQDSISARLAQEKKASETIKERVVIKYRDRTRVIKTKGKTIIKKVPVYVTRKDDGNCVVNSGFVRLWNNSNKGIFSEASEGINAEASSVKLSDIATQHAKESTQQKEAEQTLISLQDWVRKQYLNVNGEELSYP